MNQTPSLPPHQHGSPADDAALGAFASRAGIALRRNPANDEGDDAAPEGSATPLTLWSFYVNERPRSLLANQQRVRSASLLARWPLLFLAWSLPNAASAADEQLPDASAEGSERYTGEPDLSLAAEHTASGTPVGVTAAEPQTPMAPASGKAALTAYSAMLSAYPVPNLGVMAYDGAVIQSGVTMTFPNGVWFDLWNSTPLPRDGRWDLNNYGEEIDITAGYGGRMGTFDAAISFAYFASQPLGKAADDIVEVSPRLSLPITIGRATLQPYVQPQYWLGVGHADRLFLRSGTSLTAFLSPALSLSADASLVHGFRSGRTVLRAEASLNCNLGDRSTLSPVVKISSGVRPVFGLGFSRNF